jgi:hypothetical protein
MADIFISYAREDLTRAKTLALALEKKGRSVWWDRSIPAGKIFDEVIDEEIQKARCIIVLWSAASAASRWVRTEAEEGAKRNILVPILIEKSEIPLAFRRYQTANLMDWDGASSSTSFQRLLHDIATILEPSLQSTIGAPQTEQPRSPVQRAKENEQSSKVSAESARSVKSKVIVAIFLCVVLFPITLYGSWIFLEFLQGSMADTPLVVRGSTAVATIVTAVVLYLYWRRG